MINNIRDINEKVAENTGFSEELVDAVNKFYWKAIKNEIRSGENSSIRIRGLGTIATSMHKLKRNILKYISLIRAYRNPNLDKPDRIEVLKELEEDLSKLLKRRDELAQIYFLKKEKHRLYWKNRNKKENEE